MSEENLVRQCAPTLAGIKTGTIFPVPFEDLDSLTMEIRELNRILVPKGLRLLPLRYQDQKALLYLYRPSELRKDLKDRLAEALLADAGYPDKGSEQCVAYLARRFRSGGEFPHEVGLCLASLKTGPSTTNVRDFGKSTAMWSRPSACLPSTANAPISTASFGGPVPASDSLPSRFDIPDPAFGREKTSQERRNQR